MECPNCKSLYDKETRIPLLLIKCGHSVCTNCATALFKDRSIICPECKQTSQIESVAHLPKNMALLLMSETAAAKPSSPQKLMCETHNKKLEGFCEDDKKLLCINCILLDGHKAHEILPIGQAASDLRIKLAQGIEFSQQMEEKLKGMLNDISGFRIQLNNSANLKREQITALYKEISNIIHERESSLKQTVANILEREEEVLSKRTNDISAQLKLIENFRSSFSQATSESDCEILAKTEARMGLVNNANKQVSAINLNANFPEIKRNNELNFLWKILNPDMNVKGKSSNRLANRLARGNTKPTHKDSSNTSKNAIGIIDKQATIDKLMTQGVTAVNQTKPQPSKSSNNVTKPKKNNGPSKANISITSSNSSAASPKKNQLANIAFEEESVCSDTKLNLHEIPPNQNATSINKPSSAAPMSGEGKEEFSNEIQKIVPFVSPEEINATANAIAQATSKVNLLNSEKTNDIYSALREKREKHKLEKINAPLDNSPQIEPVKIESLAQELKITPQTTKNAATDLGTAIKTAWCDDTQLCAKKQETQNTEQKVEIVKLEKREEINKEEEKKPLQTPEQSITPTLYDMYINGESQDKMSLSTLLERLNEYIYVFCIFLIIIKKNSWI